MTNARASRLAGIALVGAIGITGFAAAPAAHADPTPPPASSATPAKTYVDWAAIRQQAAAAGDQSGVSIMSWVLSKHSGATPTAADKIRIENATQTAQFYRPVAEETSPSFGSLGSSGSSGGSSEGSSEAIEQAIDEFFENFDWSIITVPAISAILQSQGLPAAIALPLARIIWSAIEATFPERAE